MSEALSINNTLLSFNRIYYVDVNNGDDTAGDGSKLKPFKTIQKAVSMAGNGDAIKLSSGIYTINTFADVVTTKGLTIIGDKINTIIEISQCPQNASITGTAYFYDLIIRPSNSFSGDNRAIWYYSSGTYVLRFYNVVFSKSLNGSYPTTWFFIWAASGNINRDVIFENCSAVAVPNNFEVYGGTQQTYKNCAFGGVLPQNGTKVTCLANVTFDANYNITSSGWQNTGTGVNPDQTRANIGVYGGSFAWGYWILKVTKDYNVLGTYISQLNPDTNYSTPTQYLLGGGNQILLKTDFDKSLGYIKNATLNIGVDSLTTGGEIKIVKLNSNWDINTVTYNTSPEFDSGGYSFNVTSTDSQTLDITDLMRKIYDSDNNYGIAIYSSVAQMSLNISITLTITYIPTEIIMPNEIHSNGVLVKWKPVKLPVDSKFFHKLRLERGSVPDFPEGAGTVIFETQDINTTEYFDLTVQSNTNYYYKVFVIVYTYNLFSEIFQLSKYNLNGIKITPYGYMLSGGTVYFTL